MGDTRQDAATVIKAIKESGGISVWAHPLGGGGELLLSNALGELGAETADERGLTYDFKFCEPSEAGKANKSGKEHWFEVGEILKSKYGNVNGILGYLFENNLTASKLSGKILSTLQEKIWHSVPISFYLELRSKVWRF